MNRIINTLQLLSKIFVVGIVCFSLLTQTTVCWAQSNDAGDQAWNQVKSLTNDSEVYINLKNGKTVKGKIDSVTDSEVILKNNKKNPQIARADIKELFRIKGKKKLATAAAIGAGAGFGAGAAIGIALSNQEDITYALTIPILGGLGAGIGAGIGLIIGGKKDRELLYRDK